MIDAITGGLIIGLSTTLFFVFHGRVAGISGMLKSIIKFDATESRQKLIFLLGVILGGLCLKLFYPESLTVSTSLKLSDYIISGFFVGAGSVLANGCTSGHGICGLSRFSVRSMTAVTTFIVFGFVSVAFYRIIKGEL